MKSIIEREATFENNSDMNNALARRYGMYAKCRAASGSSNLLSFKVGTDADLKWIMHVKTESIKYLNYCSRICGEIRLEVCIRLLRCGVP